MTIITAIITNHNKCWEVIIPGQPELKESQVMLCQLSLFFPLYSPLFFLCLELWGFILSFCGRSFIQHIAWWLNTTRSRIQVSRKPLSLSNGRCIPEKNLTVLCWSHACHHLNLLVWGRKYNDWPILGCVRRQYQVPGKYKV